MLKKIQVVCDINLDMSFKPLGINNLLLLLLLFYKLSFSALAFCLRESCLTWNISNYFCAFITESLIFYDQIYFVVVFEHFALMAWTSELYLFRKGRNALKSVGKSIPRSWLQIIKSD